MGGLSRLFSLSNQKDCRVRECGFWDGLQWIWSFQWRRNLFQWELEIMDNMHQILAGEHLNNYANDRLIWKFDKKGEFSIKSITEILMEKRIQPEGFNAFNFTKSIWKGLVPPKVEILTWFVLLGRVNTKAKLNRLGILPQDQINCTFCSNYVENHEHLFYSCEYAWYLWCFCLQKWNINWVFPLDQKNCFESWMGIKLRGPRKKC